MDMKRILQALDGVATKPVVGADSMARFLRVVKEAELNQPAPVAPTAPTTPAAPASTLSPEQLEYNRLRAQIDGADAIRGGGGANTFAVVSPEVTAATNAMKQKLAQMAAALTAKGIDAAAEYDAPEPGAPAAAPVALDQKYTTEETGMSRFLSIISEGASPHKVALPVQMAMQHYASPKQQPTPIRTESLLKGYLQELDEEAIEKQLHKRQLINQYAQTIADRVMMKESAIAEMPIDMTGDPNDPTIYGHEKANPMSLKGRIMSARAQLKELAQLADSDSLVAWEEICTKAQGGMFMGLEQNIEQIRHGIEELAAKRKRGGVASRGIDKNIGEDKDPCWKNYKQVGMKKKGGKSVPNCVPKK
jgi:hypothetical protein